MAFNTRRYGLCQFKIHAKFHIPKNAKNRRQEFRQLIEKNNNKLRNLNLRITGIGLMFITLIVMVVIITKLI